jgi:hypothetical protein
LGPKSVPFIWPKFDYFCSQKFTASKTFFFSRKKKKNLTYMLPPMRPWRILKSHFGKKNFDRVSPLLASKGCKKHLLGHISSFDGGGGECGGVVVWGMWGPGGGGLPLRSNIPRSALCATLTPTIFISVSPMYVVTLIAKFWNFGSNFQKLVHGKVLWPKNFFSVFSRF